MGSAVRHFPEEGAIVKLDEMQSFHFRGDGEKLAYQAKISAVVEDVGDHITQKPRRVGNKHCG